MACALARRGDLDSYLHSSLLLQQVVRYVSYYFRCANPHDAKSWEPLRKAINVEKAWMHDATQLFIMQKEIYPQPDDPAVRELILQVLRKLSEKPDPIEAWACVRDEQAGKDGIVTIDELMSLPTNIPPPTIEFDPDPAEDFEHVEYEEESVDSVQYFYRCLSPWYLRWVARRIASEVLDVIGNKKRGLKSLLGASILHASNVACLPSVRRTWLPKEFQPFYSVKTNCKVGRNMKHDPASAPQPNMAMVAAILAQIAVSR